MIARWFYSGVFYILTPFILLWLLWQSRKNSHYRKRLKERLGYVLKPANKTERYILFHCASVGEFLAAKPLITSLLTEGHYLWVTCTTPTGSALIQAFSLNYTNQCRHSYLPIDAPFFVSVFFKSIQPAAVILMETEIWLNLIHQSQNKKIPVLLVNARMSEKSLSGYLKVKYLYQQAWQALSFCGAQDKRQAERFLQLGVEEKALQVIGNLKFDIQIPDWIQAELPSFKASLKDRLVFTAASTHANEEEIVLEAFVELQKTYPNALLILAPRHQERFSSIATYLESQPINYKTRSLLVGPYPRIKATTDVLLADSMGELMLWFGVSDISFIGGSLIERGGHNPLEALAFNQPILSGQYVFNFQGVYALLAELQAVHWVNEQNFLNVLKQTISLSKDEQEKNQAGFQFFKQYQGATRKTKQIIQGYLQKNV